MMSERGMGFQCESISFAAAILSTLKHYGFEDSLYYYGDLQEYKKVPLSPVNAIELHNIHGLNAFSLTKGKANTTNILKS